MENKQKICELLLPAVQETRNLYDFESLTYDEEREVVIAEFTSGYTQRANVAMDSGTAMISDIICQIV
ncbi:MAG: hypothetical protein Q4C80_04035 [Bacillota bacterium]|nr:hypothetical protein [Bacillota bacterium]